MFRIKTILGSLLFVSILSVGFNFLMTSEAKADHCTVFNVAFAIGDADNPILGDVECGTIFPPVAGDGQVVIAGNSGNVNAKCTGDQLLDLFVPQPAVVEDGFCCAIKVGPGIFDFLLTRDSHIVLTPSGNVNVVCKYHPD